MRMTQEQFEAHQAKIAALNSRKPAKQAVTQAHAKIKRKYGNTPTYYAGLRYDSKSEARRAEELDLMLRAGEIKHWSRQPKYHLGVPENVYIADFFVIMADGSFHAEDVKYMRTAKFNRDVKLWRSYGKHPLLILTLRGACWVAETIDGAVEPSRERVA